MRQDAYRSLRETAGLERRATRGLIAIAGSDRADYLQGQLTNDIVALGEGSGLYAAHLTPQGRMVADMEVMRVSDRLLLDVAIEVKDSLLDRFQELIFTEDVEVSDWSHEWTSIGVSGPSAERIVVAGLETCGPAADPPNPSSGGYPVTQLQMASASLVVARTDPLGMPGYTLWVERVGLPDLIERLTRAGCVEVDTVSAETVRVENGRPKFPDDLGPDVIPLEAGIEERAISLTKGCYVGQEVIIRILHRGQGRVARRLTGLTLDSPGTDPDRLVGSTLRHGDTEVGRMTSSVLSPGVGSLVGLGYVAKGHLEPGTRLDITLSGDGASARGTAIVTELPFLS